MRKGKKHVTPGTAARILGKHTRTVQRMVSRGEFLTVFRSNTNRIWIAADEIHARQDYDHNSGGYDSGE